MATLVFPEIRLGGQRFDVRSRALVMGILNRTPDSFFDQGLTWDFDKFLRRAEQLVVEGADILDVGGVKAGPGPEVSETEELERVIPAICALAERFDVPISTDTWRASVLDEACKAGAVLGNDISGFADPEYLKVAASHGASVVATHIRLAPRVADPEPIYTDLISQVEAFLLDRASRAESAGLEPAQIQLDAGLDLGKTPIQSAALLAATERLANLGYPLLLSASSKRFLGDLLGLEIDSRRSASLSAAAIGVIWGCRVVRAHDVVGTRSVLQAIEPLIEMRARSKFASGSVSS